MGEFRLHDSNTGRQLVQVLFQGRPDDKLYTYMWAGEGRLAIGDQLAINPPTWAAPDDFTPRVGIVIRMGSDYEGSIVCLTKRWEN